MLSVCTVDCLSINKFTDIIQTDFYELGTIDWITAVFRFTINIHYLQSFLRPVWLVCSTDSSAIPFGTWKTRHRQGSSFSECCVLHCEFLNIDSSDFANISQNCFCKTSHKVSDRTLEYVCKLNQHERRANYNKNNSWAYFVGIVCFMDVYNPFHHCSINIARNITQNNTL